MGYKALLTLDLENGVSSEKRKKVYDQLEKEKWSKLKSLPTAWSCSFSNDVSRDLAVQGCKDDVANAAKAAGVSTYNAAVQVCDEGKVEEFSD